VHHKETLKAVEGIAAKTEYILPIYAPAKRLRYGRHIKNLNQRMKTHLNSLSIPITKGGDFPLITN
jgi:hypothetical protein